MISMKWTAISVFLLVGLYSVALLLTDINLGQDFVRGYFSDIVTGTDYALPYKAFFGINTSITVVMLVGIALLFLVCIDIEQQMAPCGLRVFFLWSQVFFFLFLAADERLLIHEKLGSLLHVEDALLIFGLGLIELVLLIFVGRVMKQAWRVKGWLIPAALCFAVMVCIDALLAPDIQGRLAMEDLSKTWSILFLLIHAWHCCKNSISHSLHEASDGT